MTKQYYSKAPIKEAIIDLRVRPAKETDLALLEKFGPEERQRYPLRTDLKIAEGQMELGERFSSSTSMHQIGFMFHSADGKQIFQPQLAGFRFTRLAPYESWEPFRDEARRLWNLYRQLTKPQAVDRMALRYINRLDLPNPIPELKVFLRTGPEISPDLPQMMDGYFMQLNIPQEDIRARLVLTETTVQPLTAGTVSIILDIDLFREGELPQDEQGLWGLLEVLQARMNKSFEGCITDRVRELIR